MTLFSQFEYNYLEVNVKIIGTGELLLLVLTSNDSSNVYLWDTLGFFYTHFLKKTLYSKTSVAAEPTSSAIRLSCFAVLKQAAQYL